MKIYKDIIQLSPEWFEIKLGKVSASRMSAILAKGQGRQDLMEQLALERITGKREPSFSSKDMEDGIIAEPFIRQEYEDMANVSVELVGWVEHDNNQIGISPDGLIGKSGGIEIKKRIKKVQYHYAVSRHTRGPYRMKLYSGIPLDPYRQIQTSLWVTKRKWWDYVSACVITVDGELTFDYSLGEHYIIIQRVYRDEKFIAEIESATMVFLKDLDELVEKMR